MEYLQCRVATLEMVIINAEKLRVTDGALVDVRNEGSGNAGTLRVNTSSIFLDNEGRITAATASGVGGYIFLQAQNLQLGDNSAITASAGGTGNGGNITIDTDTLVALENSDITANAEQSFGGRVSINAQGIFGTDWVKPLIRLSLSSRMSAALTRKLLASPVPKLLTPRNALS